MLNPHTRTYENHSGLTTLAESVEDSNFVTINVDGLPLYRSSSLELWPIMCIFSNNSPFVVALCCRNGKPSCVDTYLQDFLEYNVLRDRGVTHVDKLLKITFICDVRGLRHCCMLQCLMYGEHCVVFSLVRTPAATHMQHWRSLFSSVSCQILNRRRQFTAITSDILTISLHCGLCCVCLKTEF